MSLPRKVYSKTRATCMRASEGGEAKKPTLAAFAAAARLCLPPIRLLIRRWHATNETSASGMAAVVGVPVRIHRAGSGWRRTKYPDRSTSA